MFNYAKLYYFVNRSLNFHIRKSSNGYEVMDPNDTQNVKVYKNAREATQAICSYTTKYAGFQIDSLEKYDSKQAAQGMSKYVGQYKQTSDLNKPKITELDNNPEQEEENQFRPS